MEGLIPIANRTPQDTTMSESSRTRSEGDPEAHPNLKLGVVVDEALSKLPAFQSAAIRRDSKRDHIIINAQLSTNSYLTKAKSHFTQDYVLTQDLELVYESELKSVAENLKVTSSSPSGKYRVNFVGIDKADVPARLIQVTSEDAGVLAEVDVSDAHSNFLTGDTWGRPVWSKEENFLVYVAEEHPAHWKEKIKPHTFYEYTPNFGEQLSTTLRPTLFLLDLRKPTSPSTNKLIRDQDAGACFVQPVFNKADSDGRVEVFATGISLLPDGRRLGQVWCYNRPAAIYRIQYNLGKEEPQAHIDCITKDDKDRSFRSPRINGANLYYLSNRLGYEHGSCAQLHKADLTESAFTSSIVVDTVVDPKATKETPDPFTGLYLEVMPTSPFLNFVADGEHQHLLCLSTQWRSITRPITINPCNGHFDNQADDELSGITILGTDNSDLVVGIKSQLAVLPELVVGRVEGNGKGGFRIKWKSVKQWRPTIDTEAKDEIPTLYSSLLSLPSIQPTEIPILSPYNLTNVLSSSPVMTSKAFSGSTSTKALPPVILMPHGGPNGIAGTSWSSAAYAYASAGFTLAFINYPGSIGFGQKNIERLTQACGELDVHASYSVLGHLVELGLATESKGKRFISGGSHGGFITGHVTSRWPQSFDGAILRNPVIDLPSCFATSDIPDWSLAQFGIPYPFSDPPAFAPEEHIKLLRESSPSHHLTQLFKKHTEPCMPPTYLVLGTDDLRVPPNQGKAWYHALKGHGENVNMLLFPGNGHPIETVWAGQQNFVGSLNFLTKYASFE